ncbi:uncharacterized protein F5891DRAFT_222445 [Suillus fuscotomentosus]|uniref:Uncharacterized protein n=1 Tax=Suillus fuscotomentosus TaxID=1912939 RepID=A0AAD4HS25_9AGAM|nr:uncharacterized protein F5891DRAFT_222445 [Suillus fuscotomentosus]KAG1908010.1 hypothetical protein F5891DRAFT_222445 [Suillus fuscotomentosus]
MIFVTPLRLSCGRKQPVHMTKTPSSAQKQSHNPDSYCSSHLRLRVSTFPAVELYLSRPALEKDAQYDLRASRLCAGIQRYVSQCCRRFSKWLDPRHTVIHIFQTTCCFVCSRCRVTYFITYITTVGAICSQCDLNTIKRHQGARYEPIRSQPKRHHSSQ